MNRHTAEQIHTEIDIAMKKICAKYGLDYHGGTLTHDSDSFRMSIKAMRTVTITTALTASTALLKAGRAEPGTKAVVFDNKEKNQARQVIITETKLKRYAFYFADDPNKRPMLGHFSLFTSTN